MKTGTIVSVLISLTVFAACNSDRQNAAQMLSRAAGLYESAQYRQAQTVLDSLKLQYPKEIKALREGLQLSRKIEISNQERTIFICDSLLPVREAELETLKKDFIYEKDQEYDDEGRFTEKTRKRELDVQRSHIQCWVSETGEFFLASVYYGSSPVNHTGMKVSLPDGTYTETATIPQDGGLNYSFRNLEITTEAVTYRNNKDNGVAMFIFNNSDSKLTAEYTGGKKYTITLSGADKAAVVKTMNLAAAIVEIEKIKKEKETATGRLQYLKTKV